VKVNYNGSSAIVNPDEYVFTFVNFVSLIPILDQSFAFPLHVEPIFFSSCDSRERGWKIVLWKDPHGRRIVENIETNPIEFDMFRVGNANEYLGLQASTSIQDSIQPTNVVGVCVVSATNLVANVFSGEEENGVDSLEDYATSNFVT
jgi:hypothetical protein